MEIFTAGHTLRRLRGIASEQVPLPCDTPSTLGAPQHPTPPPTMPLAPPSATLTLSRWLRTSGTRWQWPMSMGTGESRDRPPASMATPRGAAPCLAQRWVPPAPKPRTLTLTPRGHRRDDLLVGAPLFMARRSDGQRSELGRLYLYLGQQRLAGPPQTLTGTHPYGRFAAAIASLGDLDKDGFGGNSAEGGQGCATPGAAPGETEAGERGVGRGCSRPFCPQTWPWAPRRGVTVAAGRSSSSAGRARGWRRCPPSASTAPSPAPPPSASRCAVPPTWTATATRVQPWHDTGLAPRCHHPGVTTPAPTPLFVPADLLVGAYGAANVAVYL